MGDQHNELRRGQISAAMSRAVGDMRGGGIERYGETLTPNIDLWARAEWAFLRNERLWGQRTTASAVAAEFGWIAIVNPAGSRILTVIEKGAFDHAVAAGLVGTVGIATEATVIATLTQGAANFRDTRNTTLAAGPQTQIWNGTDPSSTPGTALERRRNAVAATFDFSVFPVVLHPGFACVIVAELVNTVFAADISGYERWAYPSELV